MHEGASGPDHVVVGNEDFEGGFRPGFVVVEGEAEEAVQDAFKAGAVCGGFQEEIPAEGLDEAGDDGFVIAAGIDEFRVVFLAVPVVLLVVGDEFFFVGQTVFFHSVAGENVFYISEGAEDTIASVCAVFEKFGVTHVGYAAPFFPGDGTVVRGPEEVDVPGVVEGVPCARVGCRVPAGNGADEGVVATVFGVSQAGWGLAVEGLDAGFVAHGEAWGKGFYVPGGYNLNMPCDLKNVKVVWCAVAVLWKGRGIRAFFQGQATLTCCMS